jgi:hypothetical protein
MSDVVPVSRQFFRDFACLATLYWTEKGRWRPRLLAKPLRPDRRHPLRAYAAHDPAGH